LKNGKEGSGGAKKRREAERGYKKKGVHRAEAADGSQNLIQWGERLACPLGVVRGGCWGQRLRGRGGQLASEDQGFHQNTRTRNALSVEVQQGVSSRLYVERWKCSEGQPAR